MAIKRTIYHKYFDYSDNENLGEMDGFFELQGKKLAFLTGWDLNDAHYRSEYMGPLFTALDIKVERLPEKYAKEATKTIMREFGL